MSTGRPVSGSQGGAAIRQVIYNVTSMQFSGIPDLRAMKIEVCNSTSSNEVDSNWVGSEYTVPRPNRFLHSDSELGTRWHLQKLKRESVYYLLVHAARNIGYYAFS